MKNRELKFRAWNGETINYSIIVGKFGAFWINAGQNNDGLDESDKVSLTPFNTKCSETTVIMQFTGMKDRNGKEIYEGDIIGDWNIIDGKKEQSRRQVFFDELTGQWMLDCSLKQDKSMSTSLYAELNDFEYEILGHIYKLPFKN